MFYSVHRLLEFQFYICHFTFVPRAVTKAQGAAGCQDRQYESLIYLLFLGFLPLFVPRDLTNNTFPVPGLTQTRHYKGTRFLTRTTHFFMHTEKCYWH